jgi:Family of unknown function (DUF6328)
VTTARAPEPTETPPAPPNRKAVEADAEGRRGRLDRELLELLHELRIILPGIQALFAFLLIVPFNDRFAGIGGLLRTVYLVALLASALACVLFITPASFHRLRFRCHDKAQLLRIGNRCAVCGLLALAVAMVAAVFFVTDFLFASGVAAVLTGLLAAAIAGLWWLVPLVFGPDR